MIANPKKEICVNFSQDEVKEMLKKLSSYLVSNGQNYKPHAYDEFLGQLKLHVYEFLSLGSYVVINVNYVDEKSTKISIEIQRAMGAFDEWHEVSKANRHLENVIKAISYLLQNPNHEVKVLEQQEIAENNVQQLNPTWLLVGAVIGWVVLKAILIM